MNQTSPESDHPEAPGEPAPADNALEDISAPRRQFFRQILALGLDRAEKVGRRVGHRFADVVEAARQAEQGAEAAEPGPVDAGGEATGPASGNPPERREPGETEAQTGGPVIRRPQGRVPSAGS